MSDQLTCPLCAHRAELTLIPHLRDERVQTPHHRATGGFPERLLPARLSTGPRIGLSF